MANIDSATGFTCTDDFIGGTALNLIPYKVDASNAVAIFRGDPITQETDGYFKASAAGDGYLVTAIAQQFKLTTGQIVNYLPALTAGTVMALPLIAGRVFDVQCDTGTAVAETAIGNTADFVTGTGSTNTGMSTYELDSSDIGTGNQCRIIGLSPVLNNAWGEHVKVRVVFVESAYQSSTSI